MWRERRLRILSLVMAVMGLAALVTIGATFLVFLNLFFRMSRNAVAVLRLSLAVLFKMRAQLFDSVNLGFGGFGLRGLHIWRVLRFIEQLLILNLVDRLDERQFVDDMLHICSIGEFHS